MQGGGAWDPKPGAFKRGKQGSSLNGLPLPLPAWAAAHAAGLSGAMAPVAPAGRGGSHKVGGGRARSLGTVLRPVLSCHAAGCSSSVQLVDAACIADIRRLACAPGSCKHPVSLPGAPSQGQDGGGRS